MKVERKKYREEKEGWGDRESFLNYRKVYLDIFSLGEREAVMR
jgi:hypothetical protein